MVGCLGATCPPTWLTPLNLVGEVEIQKEMEIFFVTRQRCEDYSFNHICREKINRLE